MAGEIINRVANSKLVTIDLEDFYPNGKRIPFDISNWLLEGIVLREKDITAEANQHGWEQYKDDYIALHCSTDAIIPGWAYLILTMHLRPSAKNVVVENLETLENIIFTEILDKLDVS